MPLFLYRLLIILAAPFIRLHVHRRARVGKEDSVRLSERYGYPSAHHSSGENAQNPVWIHAASVGEATSALTIAEIIRDIDATIPLLITTGTVTSAHLIAQRLPVNTVHQYAPYDHPVWVARFLKNWAPRASIRIESELWPNMCDALLKQGVPTVLLNAHLSDRSFAWWRMAPRTTAKILSTFSHIFADGDGNAARFKKCGAARVISLPSLKFIASPLPIDVAAQNAWQSAIRDRPVFMMASTHDAEEILAARVHLHLKKQFPNMLTVIVLRHPQRVERVIVDLASLSLNIVQRSTSLVPHDDTDLYIVDTIGELGMFFNTVPFAVIGRSFSRDGGGGHNPIEAALLGCLPITGPQYQNLKTIYDPMIAAGVTDIIETPDSLPDVVLALLKDPATTKARGQAAWTFVLSQQHHLKSVMKDAMIDVLKGG